MNFEGVFSDVHERERERENPVDIANIQPITRSLGASRVLKVRIQC